MSGSKNTKTVTRQSAGRDIRNSPQGNVGIVIGDGATGNVIIQNLHVHFRLGSDDPMGNKQWDRND